MPGSKYERELRFIQTETQRLGRMLSNLREVMPIDPIEAAKKADEALGIEAEIGRLLQRKKEIEDSFIAAGMEVPSIDRDLNENVHQDSRPFTDDEPAKPVSAPEVRPEAGIDELTEEIESVTDELMGIEIKMLRADMNGDEDEKQKLSMMASSLRSRRDSLVEAVKEIKAEQGRDAEPEPIDLSDIIDRLQELESETRAMRSDIDNIRNAVTALMRHLGIDD